MSKVDCFNLGILVGLAIYSLVLKLSIKNYYRIRSLLKEKLNVSSQ